MSSRYLDEVTFSVNPLPSAYFLELVNSSFNSSEILPIKIMFTAFSPSAKEMLKYPL